MNDLIAAGSTARQTLDTLQSASLVPMGYPRIIQGGMGVAVSGWKLARAVSLAGQLGVVSGTGIDVVLARRLQQGDPEGELRDAFDAFPLPVIAEKVWSRYFVAGGKGDNNPFKAKPIFTHPLSKAASDLLVLANFVEVFLAKRGHTGVVGINLLEKIQMGTLPSLMGALLADVDYVLMGAGIPREIPAALDQLSALEPATLKLHVAGENLQEEEVTLDPRQYAGATTTLRRPLFLAIVASDALAATLARKSTGRVDGFVIEGPTAGGHNAPPRGAMQIDDNGEPIYGPRDVPDLESIRGLGAPFWLAGSFGSNDGLRRAIASGAQGIQVGTAFAYCEESGLAPEIKERVMSMCLQGTLRVHTDPKASPTGFPFKVVALPGTISEPGTYVERQRICDLGYLREPYRRPDGKLGFRCPGEPIEDYIAKGGDESKTIGRKCLCNALVAAIGLGQIRETGAEPAIVTSGDDIGCVVTFLRAGSTSYSARDVVDRLLDADRRLLVEGQPSVLSHN